MHVALQRRRLRRRGVVLTVAAVLALTFASTALAGWSWTGTVGIGQGNGNCTPWYPGQSACPSYYANWYQLNAFNDGQGSAAVLAGFENQSTIRGVYLNPTQQVIVTPGQLSMGGIVLAHVTYCSWSPCNQLTPAAHIWFEAFQ